AGVNRAGFAESRREGPQHLHGRPRPRAVVLGEHFAVRQRNGDDLAVEEAIVTGLHSRVLALDRVAVLLLAADLFTPRDVLGGLAHRDVDVGVLLGIPGDQPRVVRVRRVWIAAAVSGDALDPDGQKHVTFAGLDRVRRDPCR